MRNLKIQVSLLAISLLVGCGISESKTNEEVSRDHVRVGAEYLDHGEYDNALNEFSKAIDIDSSNADGYYYFVLTMMEKEYIYSYFEIGGMNPNLGDHKFYKCSISEKDRIYKILIRLNELANKYESLIKDEGYPDDKSNEYALIVATMKIYEVAVASDKNNDGTIDSHDD